MAEKVEEKAIKKPNAIQKWFKETIGELRKVSWPTPHDAWRLTTIVIITMVTTSLGLWLLDLLFSFVVKAWLHYKYFPIKMRCQDGRARKAEEKNKKGERAA